MYWKPKLTVLLSLSASNTQLSREKLKTFHVSLESGRLFNEFLPISFSVPKVNSSHRALLKCFVLTLCFSRCHIWMCVIKKPSVTQPSPFHDTCVDVYPICVFLQPGLILNLKLLKPIPVSKYFEDQMYWEVSFFSMWDSPRGSTQSIHSRVHLNAPFVQLSEAWVL